MAPTLPFCAISSARPVSLYKRASALAVSPNYY
jgi:hypothetical protein